MTNALVAFIHHLAAFTLVAALVLEKVELRAVIAKAASGPLDAASAQKIATLQKFVQFELIGAMGILLCAALMAKGIGVIG